MTESVAQPRSARRIESAFPLTPAQEGMLYHTLLDPASSAYVAQVHCSLDGPLDARALRHAWDAVVAHHAALRAGFSWEKRARPIQAIVATASVPWTELDWSDLAPDARAARLTEFLASDRARGFDLKRPPLMRITLVCYAPERYEMIWTAHHILLDGWSTAIVLRDVRAAYTAFAAGAPPALPPTHPFRDFVDWLERRPRDDASAYWARALAKFPGAAELSLPRPTATAAEGGVDPYVDIMRECSPETTAAVRSFSSSARITEATLTFGACCTALARYSDRDRFAVGLTVAGRPPHLPGVENIVGMFVASVPVVVDANAEQRADAWLAALQRQVLDAQQHAGERAARQRDAAGLASGERLFDCLFAYENYPDAPALAAADDLAGVRVGPLRGVDRPDYPLTVVVSPGERLRLSAIVDTRRYERAHIERFLEHVERTLSAIARRPARRLEDLDALSPAEQARLDQWSGAKRSYPRDASLFALFEECASRCPTATALRHGDVEYTYGELAERAAKVHAALAARGIGPGDRVALLLDRGIDFVATMLGILRAGATYVPIAAGTPDARVAFILNDTGAALLVVANAADERRQHAACARAASLAVTERDAPEPAAVDGGAAAYVIYTSGSTGRPKGIAVPHRAVSRLVINSSFLDMPAAPRVGFASNVAFDASTLELWAALLHGGTLVVIDQDTLLDAHRFAGALAKSPVDLLWLTSGLFSEIARVAPHAFTPVETLIVGGDVVDPATVRAVAAAGGPRRMLNGYGPTENTTFTTTFDMAALGAEASTVPLGAPVTNTSVRVLDRHMRPSPIGVAGELYAGGDGLATAYVRRPALTAERFVPDAWSDRAGARLYRTGDLVRFTDDGTLEFLGRVDEQVKIRGFRIEPGEIEAALGAIPGIERALVVAEGASAAERRLIAYVAGAELPPVAAIRDRLADTLPPYMVPAAIVPLAAFPLTGNGKVDRRALPSPSARREPADRGDALSTERPTRRMLAGIWATLLGVDAIEDDDDFFARGGHSLIAMQLASRVREAFGIALPLRVIFDAPVLADQADWIDRLRAAEQPAPPPLVAGERPSELPLSFAQQRLWFLDRYAPLSAAYHVPHAIRLHGEIDAAALEASLSDIVARHESLRTVFAAAGGRPTQIICPPAPLPLAWINLSALAPDERERALEAALESQFGTPFDLGAGSLVRCALVRLAPDEHVLSVTMHHIVADGWSIGIFTRELGECYDARRHGRVPALPPLAVQYADFALWQRGWLDGDAREGVVGYWKQALTGARITELPPDRPRPPAQSFRGDSIEFGLPDDLAARVGTFAREKDCTPFMCLFAAYAAFVARVSGEDDLTIGVPIAGRTHESIEPLIGFFVNMLPIRVRVAPDDTFASLLLRVRAAVLDAFQHQDVPFEAIVDAVNPPRDPGRQPLVQLTFAVHDFASQELDLAGLRVGEARTDLHWVRFDAELHLWHAEGALRGYWAYASDLFERATIEAHHARFVRLLASALGDPARRVHALALLDAADEHTLISVWNGAAAPCATAALHDLVEERTAGRDSAPAIIDDAGVLTYGELRERANAVARALIARGVRPGDTVAMLLDRRAALVVAMLAAMKAGAAYAPIDPDQPGERARHMLVVAAPAAVIIERAHAARVEGTWPVLCVDAAGRVLDSPADACDIALPRIDPAQGAYVIFTSGSTGAPKAVLVPHAAIVNHMAWMQRRFPLDASDRVLQKTAVTFDASVWEFWAPLLAGATLVLATPGRHADPAYLAQAIRDHAISTIQLVPSVAELLLRAPGIEECRSLRRVFLGGEALDWPLVDRLHATLDVEVVNLYGPAEATVDATFAVWARHGEHAHRPIGLPIDNVQAFVLDRELRPVPIGVPGELYLAGHALARGYIGQPGQTAERFVPNPFSDELGARMYRTGDIVRRLRDGQLEYVGRRDHQVKIRGQRTELGEIETAIRHVPGVREAVVALAADEESVVAWVTLDDEHTLESADGARVEQWHELYEEVYRADAEEEIDPAFDIRGWNDSATGAPIPAGEMRVWLDSTLHRIRALGPRHVLEIGAGSGLIAFGIAPHVERYVATDFAAAAVERLRRHTRARGLSNVELAVAGAAETPAVLSGTPPVDVVVLNSVVQYFPSAAYLASTIERAAAVTAAGGAIFVGDVRALPLLDAHLAESELARATDDMSLDELRRRVRQRRRVEEELVLDSRFFAALRRRIPRIARVDVQLKRGTDRNELTRFRYDVTLHLDAAPARTAGDALHIEGDASLAALEAMLLRERPACVRLSSVRNARVASALALVNALDANRFARVGELRAHLGSIDAPGEEPERFWQLGDRLGYDVTVEWADDPACVDVHLYRRAEATATRARERDPFDASTLPPSYALAHDPERARRLRAAPAAIRASLESRVPRYMIPSAILALDAMPLTPNGKVDRRALPIPDPEHADAAAEFEPPVGEVEAALASIWSDVLEARRVGAQDDFFACGGNSLSAVILAAAIRERLGVDLPVARLFAATTVRAQAGEIERARSAERGGPSAVILGDATARPVFCFPPLAGYGLAFKALAEGIPTHALHAFDFPVGDPSPIASLADAVCAAAPAEPLIFVGYSAGGPVALEVAKAVTARGRHVSDLVMIDAAVVDRRARLSDAALDAVIAENLDYFENVIVGDPALRARFGDSAGRTAMSATMRAYARFLDDLTHTGRVAAAIHLVRADDNADASDDERQPWALHTTGQVHEYAGAGSHVDMLTVHAAANATLVASILDRIARRSGASAID
ncbi:MAG TPA: amino acid adenylation domain-containing protein [Gemmatimonadaceae bacterium]|nr:amino acid adenylation domain-containing protein [Gemmatimonadaceae bacterium]